MWLYHCTYQFKNAHKAIQNSKVKSQSKKNGLETLQMSAFPLASTTNKNPKKIPFCEFGFCLDQSCDRCYRLSTVVSRNIRTTSKKYAVLVSVQPQHHTTTTRDIFCHHATSDARWWCLSGYLTPLESWNLPQPKNYNIGSKSSQVFTVDPSNVVSATQQLRLYTVLHAYHAEMRRCNGLGWGCDGGSESRKCHFYHMDRQGQ